MVELVVVKLKRFRTEFPLEVGFHNYVQVYFHVYINYSSYEKVITLLYSSAKVPNVKCNTMSYRNTAAYCF